jgi:HAD superfamily 5'-nucleotidase-like hydrolase
MAFNVFVNRTLNLKKIQYIGLDMDHTLIKYKTRNFEGLVHSLVLDILVKERKYPKEILSLEFDFDRVIRGLIIDRKNGNLLKLNRYSGIRLSYHGTHKIDFATQKKFYKSIYIDLSDSKYLAVDTAFSVSLALLYAQLVDLKEAAGPKGEYPSFEVMADDIEECVDRVHADGSLKAKVAENLSAYIERDPEVVRLLERYKRHGKNLFILTNSHYAYTKLLMDYAIQPYLKEHKVWTELFEYIITGARKPKFFYEKTPFLRINPQTGKTSPLDGPLKPGIYEGGCSSLFTKAVNIDGEDILYIGDHIYGDILRVKKSVYWRTALVVEELGSEVEKLKTVQDEDKKISLLMSKKIQLEEHVVDMLTKNKDDGTPVSEDDLHDDQKKISEIDKEIGSLISRREEVFNKYWGETMRAGAEESYFSYQVERFACIYMAEIKSLLQCSPRTYFRAFKRTLPHEHFS